MNSLFNVLITGGDGQVAQAIRQHPFSPHLNLTACTRTDLDITLTASIDQAIEKFKPSVIINTAAFTAVDKAEQEKEKALLVNNTGALNLALACKQHDIQLIHLSTDYIFDGEKSTGYQEDDTPNPINIYGLSKWQGEEAIRNHCEKYFILRVSGIFSAYGNNFYNTMQRLAKTQPEIRVVADQVTCPTSADDIASVLLALATKHEHFGTYHFCSTPPVSWHGFAETVLQKPIKAISTAEYPTAAKRPAYSVLNCHKIESVFGIKQPSWEHAIWELQ